MFLHGGTKYDDVINVTLGKIQAYKSSIHHPLEFFKYTIQPKR
jgi:hypothetical protein